MNEKKVKRARELIDELNKVFAELARADIAVEIRTHSGMTVGDRADRVLLEVKFSQVL